jgi:hypothetical protein
MRLLAKICCGVAGVTFWFGGGLISIRFKTDRMTGELVGIAIAAVFFLLGLLAFHASGEDEEDPTTHDHPIT